MGRTDSTLAALLLAATALTGCAFGGNGDDDQDDATTTTTGTSPTGGTTTTTPPTGQTNTTPPLSNSSFTVATSGLPAQAMLGSPVNLTVFVNGTASATSDHVGAHFANNTTTAPSATGMSVCAHVGGALPGVLTTSCTFPAEGTWYVYGHARAADANGTFEYWATPTAVKVRNYTLALQGAPTTPIPGNTTFNVRLQANGTDNVTSDHIDVHWFNATTANPTVASASGSCTAISGPVVNTHTIECRVPNTGTALRTVFLYGHVAVAEGGVTLDWWSAPVEVTVLPQLI